MLLVGGCIFVALIWFYGACVTISDLDKNGKSLDDYRKKYGKDLGMLTCIIYRSLRVILWPLMGGVGFFLGLIRDISRFVTGKPVVKTTESE